jgi:hypothetical protein
MEKMKRLIQLEELLMLGLGIYLFSQLDYAWWLFAVLFLSPDLSMVGYLASPQVGAFTYNLVHHKGTGVVVYVLGAMLANPALLFAGSLLFAHSSFDRVFGYGLKYPDAFQHTHLGMIGKAASEA